MVNVEIKSSLAMEPETYRRQGAVVHSWGAFRVRAPTTLVTEGRPDRVMSWHMVSIMIGSEGVAGERQEQVLGTLDNADITLPGLVKMLRASLRGLEYTLDSMAQHLHEMEDPERMVDLQATLEEETREREQGAESYDDASERGQWERVTTAEQVLANQHADLRRLQTLYEAIQVGLHDLEEGHPELRRDGS